MNPLKNFSCTCLIPARMSSSRFPGKPLVMINDRPLIQHVYDRAKKWEPFGDQVFVVSPDQEITDKCSKLGIRSLLTWSSSNDCLDCAAMGIEKLITHNITSQRYIIIQGDEPLFDCSILDSVNGSPPISNLYTVSKNSLSDLSNRNVVKVLVSMHNKAIYFSRYGLPHSHPTTLRKSRPIVLYKQLGIYIFSAASLLQFHLLPPAVTEDIEGIGLNRLIENDVSIQMQESNLDCISVDIPSDIPRVIRVLNGE